MFGSAFPYCGSYIASHAACVPIAGVSDVAGQDAGGVPPLVDQAWLVAPATQSHCSMGVPSAVATGPPVTSRHLPVAAETIALKPPPASRSFQSCCGAPLQSHWSMTAPLLVDAPATSTQRPLPALTSW